MGTFLRFDTFGPRRSKGPGSGIDQDWPTPGRNRFGAKRSGQA